MTASAEPAWIARIKRAQRRNPVMAPDPDLSPSCPHCGDLCDPGSVICVECGTRLYDRRPEPEEQ